MVLFEVVEKKETADALVAIEERVVLDHEIEQMRGANWNVRIDWLTAPCLLKVAKDAI